MRCVLGFAYSETSTSTVVPALKTGLLLANTGKNHLLSSRISEGDAVPGCFTQSLEKKHFEIAQGYNVKITTTFSLHLESIHSAKSNRMSTRQSLRHRDS